MTGAEMEHEEYMAVLQRISRIAEAAAVDVSHGNQRRAAFAIRGVIDEVHARIREGMYHE